MTKPSQRIAALPTFAVAEIAETKRRLLAEGRDIIDLGAGDADLAPPEVAIQALTAAMRERSMSRYAYQIGLMDYREAITRYMQRRFGVVVDPLTEVLPLIGSKDGIAHLPFAVINPGDVCVVPDPGYPAYAGGAILAGGDVERVVLRAENDFLVDLGALPAARRDRTKLVYLNYPNNPTGAVAPLSYLAETLAQCQRSGAVLAYDNPYVDLTFDGYRAPSVLELAEAMDSAIEFHSFSKSFGMTGWRLGWAVGNSHLIKALSKVKSYVDTGPFLAIQRAGAEVLDRAAELVEPIRAEFERRRDALVASLRDVGFPVEPPRATMYLWAALPDGVRAGPLASDLLTNEGLVVLPGSAFGSGGEGFVRFSFVAEPNRMADAASRYARGVRRVA